MPPQFRLGGPVQREGGASEPVFGDGIRQAAQLGIRTASTPLPFAEQIQRSFGRHDLSSIQAHLGPEAGASAIAMNAAAFATGPHVVFAGSPSLRTVAHEAAHVIQQSGGVQLSGGIGKAGDPYEQHADAVADRVAAGQSAEDLLDQVSGSGTAAGPAPIQRLTYMQLSDSQQSQIDAISENLYYRKARAFETRLGQVAAADGRSDAIANQLLAGVANAHPVQAADILAQQGNPLDVKLPFMVDRLGGLEASPQVEASRTEEIAQTNQIPPGLEPDAGTASLIDPDTGAVAGPLNANPGGVEQQDTMQNGQIREDSAYAAGARANKIIVTGTGSREANLLFRLATQLHLSLPDTKLAAYGWLLPAGTYSFHEIMMAAQDNGLAYTPGPDGYQEIAPLTQGDIGLHFPGHFLEPDFLLMLALYFYPDPDTNQRDEALAHIPADLHAALGGLAARFRQVRSEAHLAPLLGAGMARVLVENLSAPVIAALTDVVNTNAIAAAPNYAAVQATPLYAAVVADSDESTANLIFQHLMRQAHHPGGGGPAETEQTASIARALQEGHVEPPADWLGFSPADRDTLAAKIHQTAANYGPHDRGVALDPDAILNQVPSVEALSIEEYTSNNFGQWHGLFQNPTAALGNLPDDDARNQAVGRIHGAKAGLSRLPVYPGPVYRGTGAQQVPDEASAQAAEASFSPGNIIAHRVFLSAAKSIADSFIGPLGLAFVIDGVKTGRDIQLISQMPREREVLFPPDARFVVTRTERRLTPGPHNTFTAGNLYIFMREIGSDKGVMERGAVEISFERAYERQREGRRLVDDNLYNPAFQSYMDETAPAAPPEHRFSAQEFTDWSEADAFIRGLAGRPLTGAEIQQAHALAARSIAAVPGAVRGEGQDVIGTGGMGPNGHWSRLSAAELVTLTANPYITLQQLGVYDDHLSPEDRMAGYRTAIIAYPAGGQAVQAALNQFMPQYTDQFNRVLGMDPGPARDREALRLAALAQRTFVSIHPFGDGNGRISRLLMDHVLLSFGLEFALLANPGIDYMVDEEAWIAEVQRGVQKGQGLKRTYMG